ncbi:MAG: TM2 domain-containing protein [Gemmatimonadota bacterium]
MNTTDISDRSRGVALILGGVLGWAGGHRFYAGKNLTGVLMLCTMGGLGIWWLYDMILITAGAFKDADEKRLLHWWEPSPYAPMSGLTPQQLEMILDELDMLRGDVGDLSERMEFMERVLARAKEREALPPV